MGRDFKFQKGDEVVRKHAKFNKTKGTIVSPYYSTHGKPMYLVSYYISPEYQHGGCISYNEENIELYVEPPKKSLCISKEGEILNVGDLVILNGLEYGLDFTTNNNWGRVYIIDSSGILVFIERENGSVWNTQSSILTRIEKGKK